MTNKIILLSSLALLLLFSGCTNRKIIVPRNGEVTSKSYPNNTWAKETNVEENIGTSDLEKEEVVLETQTDIILDNESNKMERVPFPTGEYSRLSRTGKGTVKGHIYLKNAYDKQIPGKTTRLYLNPITSYSRQWYNESYLSGYKMTKADGRLYNYLRFTVSDNQGNFIFSDVPSGSYYLIGTVKCGRECGYSTAKSVRIATQVSISGNQIIQRDLSRFIE